MKTNTKANTYKQQVTQFNVNRLLLQTYKDVGQD